MDKYLLHPGYVVSKTDGDRHYITSRMLMKLYNVPPKDCVTYLPYRPYLNQDKLIDLYPMASGKYKNMQKQERAVSSSEYANVTVIQETTSADNYWEVTETIDEVIALIDECRNTDKKGE